VSNSSLVIEKSPFGFFAPFFFSSFFFSLQSVPSFDWVAGSGRVHGNLKNVMKREFIFDRVVHGESFSSFCFCFFIFLEWEKGPTLTKCSIDTFVDRVHELIFVVLLLFDIFFHFSFLFFFFLLYLFIFFFFFSVF